jgi:hypothetical protein
MPIKPVLQSTTNNAGAKAARGDGVVGGVDDCDVDKVGNFGISDSYGE